VPGCAQSQRRLGMKRGESADLCIALARTRGIAHARARAWYMHQLRGARTCVSEARASVMVLRLHLSAGCLLAPRSGVVQAIMNALLHAAGATQLLVIRGRVFKVNLATRLDVAVCAARQLLGINAPLHAPQPLGRDLVWHAIHGD